MVRVVMTAVLGLFLVLSPACRQPAAQPRPRDLKIGDLRTLESEKVPENLALRTANFDVHIYELPADKAAKLDDVWAGLYERGLTFYNYSAFAGNLFRVAIGRRFSLSRLDDIFKDIGSKQMAVISVLLPEGRAQDIRITWLDRPQEISFVDLYLLKDKILIGPGNVSLRLIGSPVPGIRGVCQLVAYPAFTLPMASPVGPMAELAKQREVEFKPAGFGSKISPDEFLVLGPANYVSERVSLGGLFFTNLEGTMFPVPGKRPIRKTSVRVFVLVCTGINYLQ